jgi:LacI family transcriptional regulator
MGKHITIKDIAKALGISTSTVSRALADTWDVKHETRDKVLAMARELNYHPNLNAKNLHNKRSGIIGVIIPEFINGFFPTVIEGIQEVLQREGYGVLIVQSNESREQERKNLYLLDEKMVEGIIISITNEGGNEEHYKHIMDAGTPIVFFNRVCENLDAPKVVIDDTQMAEMAVNHLINSGYKRIAHLAGPSNLLVAHKRIEGYKNALRKHNIDIDEQNIIESGIFIKDGINTAKQMLNSNIPLPDAIFCFNDPVAIGAMKALKEAGVRIPDDVAIVGFSEDIMATIVEPPLTSVRQPMKEMGQQAAKLILEQIKSEKPIKPKTYVLEAKLNIRKSSKR